jgi:putative mycofactocin binding protein MftB
MESITATRYKLAPGTQLRVEDFGLLFYTMVGPRLYFVSCGKALEPSFFEGKVTLDQWLSRCTVQESISKARLLEIGKSLNQLEEKGVILEC